MDDAQNIKRAWFTLLIEGVTADRARGDLATGIDVLATRYRKGAMADRDGLAVLRARVEELESLVLRLATGLRGELDLDDEKGIRQRALDDAEIALIRARPQMLRALRGEDAP